MTWLERFKMTCFVRFYTFLKIPLIWWIRPSVIELNSQRSILKIPLTRRTRNHLRSMYFGAMAIGAEVCVAMRAVKTIIDSKKPVDFVFKDFKIEFLKRAEGDVHFIFAETQAVEELTQKAIQSGERQSQTFHGYGIVPSLNPEEKILTFSVTLSLKLRQKSKKN
jgi:hypothetical protein